MERLTLKLSSCFTVNTAETLIAISNSKLMELALKPSSVRTGINLVEAITVFN